MLFVPRILLKGRGENMAILICFLYKKINTLILCVFNEGPGLEGYVAPVVQG